MTEPAKRRGRPPKPTIPDATPVRILAPSLWWGGVRHSKGEIIAMADPAPFIARGQVEAI